MRVALRSSAVVARRALALEEYRLAHLAPAIASSSARLHAAGAASAAAQSPRRWLHASPAPYSSEKPAAEAAAGGAEAAAGDDAGAAAGSGASASASAAGAGAGDAPPKKVIKNAWSYRFLEGVKDVFAVTFGLERKRDLGAEYDAGLREYPWVCYVDPHTDKTMYMNKETGVVTEHKPDDFDTRAPPTAVLETNVEASALTLLKDDATKSGWERTLDAVTNAPLISHLVAAGVAAGEIVADSPVGALAKKVKTKVEDKVEDAREVWDTSQHPLIVNASYAVDAVLSESEQGRALREIQQIDAGFDQYAFIDEMTKTAIPTVASAFFKLDMPVLRHWCKDTALAQVRAVAAAREIEGLKMDGTILNVHRTEMFQAKSLERGLPIIVVTAQVQYIHCVRNRKGEVTEGSDSEIRATTFVLAVTREADEKTGALQWKVVEISMQGSMLYL